MGEKQIYKKIRELSEELCRQGIFYTRADLAYELKSLGVGADSLLLSEWVWKAYVHYHKDEKIHKAFVNNEKKRYIVDEFCVYPLAEQGNSKELSKVLESSLTESQNALSLLDNYITKALSDNTVRKGASITLGTITGTKGVSDVQATAASVFQGYTDMVNSYDIAKGEVKAIISDFVNLRNYINDIYCKYVLILTDIFGDSIKAVSPRLFDFDSIQYLDVQDMLQNVQLEYDQVMGRCGELMGSISESFSNSVKNASSTYRQAGNKKVGLMLAGIEMFNHYLNAGQQTNELRRQLLSLQNNVKHDATQIKGDMGRLMVIYKGMNDLHIPRAEAFYRYSKQILDSDLNRLIETLYSSPELSALKQERDELLEQHKEITRVVSDSQLNISYYTSHIAECEALISSMKTQYREAKSTKPEKPFFLWNILSLGSLSKKYNREISEWYHNCQPVITQYEELQVDVNLDKEDINVHKKAYENGIRELKAINQKLQHSSHSMMQVINVNTETKRTIISQLDTLIKLLRIAKEITETKLDTKLIHTVTITDYRNEKLPVEITKNIQALSQTLGDVHIDSSFARSTLDELGNGEAGTYSEEDLQAVTQAQNEAVQNAAVLFRSWLNLQMQKTENHITAEKYDAELDKLQSQFQNEFKAIDNKSAVLQQVLKQINLHQNDQQLKEGLQALANMPKDITDQDWNDFFNGTKTLEI